MLKNLIIGNWKMNDNYDKLDNFCTILEKISDENQDIKIGIAINFLFLKEAAKKCNFLILAQSCSEYKEGSYTGETSVKMLKKIGIKMSIIGHSERRTYFNESNDSINRKIKLLVKNNMQFILCIGENINIYEKKETKIFLKQQIIECLNNVRLDSIKPIIAYEPIWAIGTGKTANAEYIQDICKYIRNVIKNLFTKLISDNTIIQYGGSVSSQNIHEIMKLNDVNGVLVGGASLEIESFGKLIKNGK